MFGRQDGEVVEVYHGGRGYMNDRCRGPEAYSHPAEWEAYEGHYTSHNPWFPGFRVLTRKGRLLLIMPDGEEEALEPLREHEFRVGGGAHSPERLERGMFVDGEAHEACLSGAVYHRSFTP
jgi:hypothetical protein